MHMKRYGGVRRDHLINLTATRMDTRRTRPQFLYFRSLAQRIWLDSVARLPKNRQYVKGTLKLNELVVETEGYWALSA